jgi:hypothetical protein
LGWLRHHEGEELHTHANYPRSPDWLKFKNPACEGVKREAASR